MVGNILHRVPRGTEKAEKQRQSGSCYWPQICKMAHRLFNCSGSKYSKYRHGLLFLHICLYMRFKNALIRKWIIFQNTLALILRADRKLIRYLCQSLNYELKYSNQVIFSSRYCLGKQGMKFYFMFHHTGWDCWWYLLAHTYLWSTRGAKTEWGTAKKVRWCHDAGWTWGWYLQHNSLGRLFQKLLVKCTGAFSSFQPGQCFPSIF